MQPGTLSMTNATKKRLLDVVDACEVIAEFVAGKSFNEYEADRLLRSAVERQIEIIGEALNKAAALEPALAVGSPDLLRIVCLRSRLIHGYADVDDEILWDVVQTKLRPLQVQVAAVLQRDGD